MFYFPKKRKVIYIRIPADKTEGKTYRRRI